MPISRARSQGASTYRRRVEPDRLRRLVRGLTHGGRILLASSDRHELAALSQKLGLILGPEPEILAVRSPSAAIAAGGRVDLALLDYELGPDITGIDLLGMLHHMSPGATFKSVLFAQPMTGEIARRATDAGFSAAVAAEELDSITSISAHLWQILKPSIDWSASWRGLP